MGVSLYAQVPGADQHGGIAEALGRALTSKPVALAARAGLGLLLLVAGVGVLTPAIMARRPHPVRGQRARGDHAGGEAVTRPITVTPIGVVSGGRSEIFEDHWGPVVSRLVLDSGAQGLDAIDGTPILDIKPYATEFEPGDPVREPAWMRELMRALARESDGGADRLEALARAGGSCDRPADLDSVQQGDGNDDPATRLGRGI